MGHLSRRTLLSLAAASTISRGGIAATPLRSKTWYCPASLAPDRTLRPDFVSSLMDDSNWSVIAPRVGVLKFYIEAMTPESHHLTEADLRNLVAVCKRHNFAAAFEVGGVRMNKSYYGAGSGKHHANRECSVLQRWTACGGSVNYITTDNAVMNTIALVYQRNPPPLGTGYKPSIPDVIAEAASAMEVFASNFPEARIGSTESLGYFSVVDSAGKRMRNLDPTLVPEIPLENFITHWLEALSHAGVTPDHFHIDFGYEGVLADGGRRELDFRRVAIANRLFRSRSIKTGIMVGAFDRYSLGHTKPVDEQAGDESAVANTIRYFDSFLKAGIPVDQTLFDRWEPYPAKTGPASDSLSDMGLTEALLLSRGSRN